MKPLPVILYLHLTLSVLSRTALIFLDKFPSPDDAILEQSTVAMFKENNWTTFTTTNERVSADLTGKIDLYVQPGGNKDVSIMFNGFSSDDVKAIQNFVNNGGKYYGICLGAFLAGPDFFNIIPWGSAIQNKVGFLKPALTKFTINGTTNVIYTQEPPELGKHQENGIDAIGNFPDGSSLFLVKGYGKGKVGLMAAHPEAQSSWSTDTIFVEDNIAFDTGILLAEHLFGDYSLEALSAGAILGIVLASVAFIGFLIGGVIYFQKRRHSIRSNMKTAQKL
ncbi:hypothetical protein HK099_005308 [Clydaea vesicula]|uniref:Biotin-protein ligase N-terminal domain-containing protein n=1 Tax=Clydaea vesicula TaxID=447962 RepID=A0AAD5XZP0_9FUNG|nr:hypothetical protein HK099_005308 [Clydaea vesicula]KAJ3382966.1 hypothetical protein HDU92_004484 [Lobulomyces angularis]